MKRRANTRCVSLVEGYGKVEVSHHDGNVVVSYDAYFYMTPKQARRLARVLNEQADAAETGASHEEDQT